MVRKNREVKIAGKIVVEDLYIIAGQCTIDVKNPALFQETSHALKEAGVNAIRGGVWKPRTLPSSYQGDDKSLQIIADVKKSLALPIVVEIMEEYQIDLAIAAGVDVFQVGARNSLNYGLLKSIGKKIANRPEITVLHKRPIHMGDIDEWIGAADYVGRDVIFCPRGFKPTISGFRNHPDESITLLLNERVGNPVIVDPSHSMGRPDFVKKAALAAIAYGCDGLIIESHIDPPKGLGDDPKQSILPKDVKELIPKLKQIYQMVR